MTIGGGFYGPCITLTKAGAGALTLSSSSGQIPAVVLNAGQLNINAADISSLTINGGSIDNTSGSTVTLSNNPTQTWNADFTFVGSNPLNMGSGAVTLGGNRAVTTSASTLTINGAVSGAFSLTKAGAGTLALGGANTFSGGTTLSAGQLNINNATALGTGRFTIGGGSIDNTTSGSITLSNNNTESWNGDFTFIGTKPLNLGTGAITLGSSRTVTVSASTLTVGGALGDSGQGYGLTKAGSGTLLLNAANTYSGSTNINAGIVQLGNTNAAQNTFVTIGANNGLAFTTAINNFTLGGLAGNANETLTDVGSNAIALTEGGNGSNSIYSGLLSGSGSLKVNGGALTLTGANTFSGGTLVAAGQLNINNATAIGSGALTINSGTIDNTSGGTITLGNNNVQTWGGNFIFGGTNDLNLGAGAVTLTSNRTVTTTAGTLTEGGIIGGAFSLTKLGSGALKLTGNSTFSGGVTIGGGSLLADNSSGSGAGSGAVTVNSGATLGGTGTISGAVTVNSGGTLTPGDGGTAIFNTGTLVLSSGSNLNIVLNGNTAGSGYSRVNVSGSATITGSNLNLSGTRSAHDGAQLSVINTTNGLTGTFSGLVQNGTVTFNGVVYSANYSAGGGNNMVLTANPATSTTTVSSSANSSVYGQTIVLTATLSSASSGTPTGTVTFYDGTTQIGQATLSLSGGQDQASIGTSALTLGSHSITASYGGDTNFTASTSAALTQTVSQDATNISIASSVNPSVFEQPVIFTATVTAGSPGSGTATGTVTFYDGSTQIGQSQLALVNGQDQASVSVSALSVASHSISAVYAGDSNFTASTSGTVSQTVNSEAPTISISGNSSVSVGSSYTLNLSAQYPSFDVDGDTISSWSINWGDGSSAQNVSGNGTNSISVTHSFTSTGNPVITASATDDDGGPYNSTNSITVAVSDPSTTDLIATATTTGSTYLRWVHDGANATYNIYRSTDGTNFSLITTVTGSAADSSATDLYQDTGLSPDTAYYYHVNKVFNSTVGPNSNTASATTAASSNNYGNQAIDTIVIPVFGEIVQSNVTLAAGAHYELIASGTMYLGGTTVPRADAEYGYDPYQDYHNPNSPWTDAVNFGISVNDTSIDKNHTYWGPYNTNHTYAIDVIGTGQKFSFVFFDDLYSDNAQDNNPGPLQVQIFGFSNPLAAAASLTATAETTRPAIDLGWHETSNNETAFEIDRSTDGTNFSALTTINENQPITINDFTYQDTAVTPGQTYYYRVIAEAGSTSAPPSNIARAQVPAFLPNVSLGSIPSSQ